MFFDLSAQERSIRDNAFAMAATFRAQANGRFSKSLVAAFAKQGLTALLIPASHGGAGFNAFQTALTLEGLTTGGLENGHAFSLAAHLFAGLFPLVKYGSEAQQQTYFPKILSGELTLANAMSEPSSGSDAFALKTTATETNGQFALKGEKCFCTNASIAGAILVYALTDPAKNFFGGLSCFLLEAGVDPFTVTETSSSLKSTITGSLHFDLSVNSANLLGRKGAGAMLFMESMNWERAGMAAMHCGTMEFVCRKTAEFVKSRTTAAGTLADLQAVQFHLAEMSMRTDAARLLAYEAAKLIDAGKDATAACARAKIFCSESLDFVVRTAMQLHGGMGLEENYGLSDLLLDAQAAAIYSGPNDVLRNLIASRL